MSYLWKVPKICDNQKLDIKKENLISDYFRKCEIYKDGGGYDKFPGICEKRLGLFKSKQFVVQLFRCSLKCPYCYVTQDGINGDYKYFTSDNLLEEFYKSKQEIFHLMGGAPAIYLKYWKQILSKLDKKYIFHSDFVLNEQVYKKEYLDEIATENSLYAVSIKGSNKDNFFKNTGAKYNEELIMNNLKKIANSKINFYLTFTNMSKNDVEEFKSNFEKYSKKDIFKDSFIIDLVNYKALKGN